MKLITAEEAVKIVKSRQISKKDMKSLLVSFIESTLNDSIRETAEQQDRSLTISFEKMLSNYVGAQTILEELKEEIGELGYGVRIAPYHCLTLSW